MNVDEKKIEEYVTHSWYTYTGGDNKPKHPYNGEQDANYTGPKPPYDYLNTDEKYSWVKAPRYDDTPMEVGPLARMIVGYAKGQKEIKSAVDYVLKKLNVGPEVLFSTLGRTAARGIETLITVERLPKWINMLVKNINTGDYETQNDTKWDPKSWPASAKGYGWHEAPRGALGHWIVINDGAIKNYQAVVPSTWNAGPRDANGTRGQYEESLIGTPVADTEKPLEILRTIHSFDPCLACAVHIYDDKGDLKSKVKVL